MELRHEPVLLEEVINYLAPQSNENFVDCTLGGGGHAQAILKRTGPNGELLGIDLDPNALSIAADNLKEFKGRIKLIQDNFKNLKEIIPEAGFNQINGILLDLGLSNIELQGPDRGFSFKGADFLDMRFGQQGQTAADILNKYKEEDLVRIFKEYGEERYAKEIANEIVKERKNNKIERTDQLVNLIEKVYKNKIKPKKINVATKVFQALRIEVNDELNNLKAVLPVALELLAKDGRLVIISFHSLEDRIVKEFFKREAKDCLCPPQIPVCCCGHKASLKIITKKVVVPSSAEIQLNPKSRSAKLRAARKII